MSSLKASPEPIDGGRHSVQLVEWQMSRLVLHSVVRWTTQGFSGGVVDVVPPTPFSVSIFNVAAMVETHTFTRSFVLLTATAHHSPITDARA